MLGNAETVQLPVNPLAVLGVLFVKHPSDN